MATFCILGGFEIHRIVLKSLIAFHLHPRSLKQHTTYLALSIDITESHLRDVCGAIIESFWILSLFVGLSHFLAIVLNVLEFSEFRS